MAFCSYFFVYVGLQINLKVINLTSLDFWILSFVLLFIAIVTKLFAGFFIKGDLKEKLSVGFSMLPRGEVGLIFAELGRISKIYNDELYAVIIFVVALTTLISPIVLKSLWKDKIWR